MELGGINMKAILFAAALALCLPTAGVAQEVKPARADDVTFHWVEFTKFHPGKNERASDLARKHFEPVDKELGIEVISIHLLTGDWDRVEVLKMQGGAADLGWRVSPDVAKFMNVLARREGGMAAAQKLLDEYDSLIARKVVSIGHMHP
jgi:hypothetical protein